ncbi:MULTISPECIES: methyl-accepting chemotaxis protein [unclassified Modestobacter]
MDVDNRSAAETEDAGPLAVFGRVGLRGRLLAAILVVALATLTVGVLGIQRMSTLSHQAQDVYDRGTVPLEQLDGLESLWWEQQAYSARSAMENLPDEVLAQNAEAATEAQGRLAEALEAVDTGALAASVRGPLEQFREAAMGFFDNQAQILENVGNLELIMAIVPQQQELEVTAIEAITTATAAQSAVASATAQEAESAYVAARTLTIVVIVAGIVLSVLLSLLLVRSITRPVQRVREVLDRVAEGDLSVRAGETGGAEIGEVAASLDRTLDSLGGVLRLVDDSAGQLAAASQQLNASAGAMAENARTSAGQADVVVASAGEVAASVDTVSTGSHQMESAIREISQNASEASRVANEAVGVAEETNRMVGKLGDSSQEIAAVVKLINGIAEQTNLLALNATIEAARAGESGKGFAVVASEVKELAQETARATEDIHQRVEAIQADTAGAVSAIGEISSVIGQINDFQATIAAAVEEQTATTNEMNRNVGAAASSSQSIASAISGLAAGTAETNQRVEETQRSAAELSRMSDELQAAVRRFTL